MRCPAALAGIPLAAGVSAGIFLSISCHVAVPIALWVAAIGAFVARRDVATIALLACGFFTAGMALGRSADSASRQPPLRVLFDRHLDPGGHQIFAIVYGRLRSDAARGPASVTLDVFVDRVELNGSTFETAGGALIGVGGEVENAEVLQWRGGRRVAFPASLRRPTRYLNPGVPDGERQLAWRGTPLVGSVKSGRLVEVVARGSVTAEVFASGRAAVRRAVASSVGVWSERSAAVVTAILIGDRAGLTSDVERRLQEAGTYHVIAISGGNIAIIAGIFVFLCRALRIGPRAAATVVVAVLSVYALAIDGGPSVGRATLMAVIYFAAGIWDHRATPLNVAAISAAVVLCADPLQLADAGFALTFAATLGILIGLPRIAGAWVLSGWRRAPLALVAASVSAETALLPVGAFVFSRVTFAGLIVNFAAIPMMTVVQIAGTGAVAASVCVPAVLPWVGWLAHMGVEGLIGSAMVVDWMPWLTRRLAPPALALVAAYYAALSIAMASPVATGRAVRRTATLGALACGVWIVVSPATPWSQPRRLRVTFLDVGQGEAAIVQFPDGRTLGIDAGGVSSASFDLASRVIAPAFWALGVRRLDYMSITHGDVDHIGGAASLFRDFRPFEVWEGVPVPRHGPTQELRMLADAAGAPWRTVQPRDRMSFGAVELLVHHPPIPEWERQRIRNDDSEVLELRSGGVSFVFTGDIGRDVERTIAPGFERATIRILKVPHHGSGTSSSPAFLDALRPDIAVISAGRGNPFGHPVGAVLDRYRDAGAAIYRTDHDGAVTVETDGTAVRVRTFNGRQLTLTTKGRR